MPAVHINPEEEKENQILMTPIRQDHDRLSPPLLNPWNKKKQIGHIAK